MSEDGPAADTAVEKSVIGRSLMAAPMLELFDALVNVLFCVKDSHGVYVEVNHAFVHRSGKRSKRDVLGKRATDFFPEVLASRYEEQDAQVFESGEPLRDELELIRRPDGSTGWYLTTKLPVRGEDGEIVALVNASRDLQTPSDDTIAVESLNRLVGHVNSHLADSLRVSELARVADCSVDQLERRLKKVFGLTPTQYVLRCRVEHAMDRLRSTETPLATIAATVGFYDQASFTKTFARLTGETPAQFRESHKRS